MRNIKCLPLTIVFIFALLCSGCSSGRGRGDASGFAPGDNHRLVVYTSHKFEVYWPIVKEFEERTGIWVEIVEGGTSELLERIAGEADEPVADLMFGGGVESLESYGDYFSPYLCADAGGISSYFRSADDLWTPFSLLPVVMIYNTKLVPHGQLAGWADLFEDNYRGKIAFADPSKSGSGFTELVTLMEAMGISQDETLRAFAAALAGRQLDDSGSVLTAVAEGHDLVGITLEETALQRISTGHDIAMVYPSDGTSCVPDGSALVKGAANERNAKLFLDFTVSRDVQQLLADRYYRRPVRVDVEHPTGLAALEDIMLIDYDVDWATQNRDTILADWSLHLGGEVTS